MFAAEDVLVAASSIHNVRVSACTEGQEDWIVEKVIIGNEGSDILATPTVWIHSKCPYLPVANPGIRPQYIHVGDVVGYLKNPEDYLNQ